MHASLKKLAECSDVEGRSQNFEKVAKIRRWLFNAVVALATVSINVTAQTDLAVFKTGNTNGGAGTNISFTITVTNLGPSTANNVIVVDQLPPSYTFIDAVPAAAGVFNNLVIWPAFDLASFDTTNFLITVTPISGGVFTNVASCTSSTPDPNPANNDGTSPFSQAITSVSAIADVAVSNSGPTTVNVGASFGYTIIVTNFGPAQAENVVVSDILPTNFLFVSASGGGVLAGNVVTWPTIASLPNGQVASFSVKVAAMVTGDFTNVALSTSSTPDPDPSNNDGSALNSRVLTSVVPGQFYILQGANQLNPQTGLYEQSVTVNNIGSTRVDAFRLLVGDIGDTNGVRTNVFLYNATATNVDSRPYIQYNSPLDLGGNVTLILEFYVPDRQPFTNSLEVLAVLPSVSSTNVGAGITIGPPFMDSRFTPARFVLEWTSVPGTTYTVIYSDVGPTGPWLVATPSITASANRVQWYDDGPPETISVPTSVSSRYYRVIANP